MTAISTQHAEQVEQLYLENRTWLSIFIQRRLGCPDDAADLVHDTYLRVLKSDHIPSGVESKRFLTHIAKGLLIDRYRRKQFEIAYQEHLKSLPEVHALSAEAHVQMIETLMEIDTLLRSLPDKVRQAFIYRQLDHLSYKDIAERLSVSVSSVEKYVAKALQVCMAGINQD